MRAKRTKETITSKKEPKKVFVHFSHAREKEPKSALPPGPLDRGCNSSTSEAAKPSGLRAETTLRKSSCVPLVASDQRSSVGIALQPFLRPVGSKRPEVERPLRVNLDCFIGCAMRIRHEFISAALKGQNSLG